MFLVGRVGRVSSYLEDSILVCSKFYSSADTLGPNSKFDYGLIYFEFQISTNSGFLGTNICLHHLQLKQ